MSDFRRVTDELSVSPQLDREDIAAAAAAGFRTILNNRPDGEAPDQPTGAEVEAWARDAGLAYLAAPVRVFDQDAVDRQAAAIREAEGPVLAFCKSGTRSITTWALAKLLSGEATRDELVEAGERAGYDLSRLPG